MRHVPIDIANRLLMVVKVLEISSTFLRSLAFRRKVFIINCRFMNHQLGRD